MLPPTQIALRTPEEFAIAAGKLLASHDDAGSPADAGQIAARAVHALDEVSRLLVQLLGAEGTRAVLVRSVALTVPAYPWLANTIALTAVDQPWAKVVAALEQHSARTIHEAFVALLSTFCALLERLIGTGLVAQVLREVWPDVFPRVVEETK